MAEADVLAVANDEEARALRHVSRRFLWFLFLLLMINFVDRSNVGFAALAMNRELSISASIFGLAVAMFSTGYMICEIPSNMILARVGARRWLSRIVISWGLASMACALVAGAQSLVALRFLVGVAEAGFFPGVILFITYWYPQYYRARAQMAFMVAQPMANAVGAMLSGLILGLDGALGIAGWRWIFLLEGLPAVLLGIIALYYLTDRPESARWLSTNEKAALAAILARDAALRDRALPRHPTRSLWRQVLGRTMLLMSFCFGTMVGNFNALAIWMPQIIRGMTGPAMPYWVIGMLTAIPPLCTLAAMPFWSWRSDRTKERYWHCTAPIMVAALAWFLAAIIHQPALQLACLTLASIASVAAWPLFVTLPSLVLPREAHPVGIAFMTTIGLAGAVVSPIIVGTLRDLTGDFAAGMAATGGLLALGAIAMLFVPRGALAAPGAHGEAPPAIATAGAR
jgi:MFS transporter, ACS family, 4-hydroxyphenylacetate permease